MLFYWEGFGLVVLYGLGGDGGLENEGRILVRIVLVGLVLLSESSGALIL